MQVTTGRKDSVCGMLNMGPRTTGRCVDLEFRGKVFTGDLSVACGDDQPLERVSEPQEGMKCRRKKRAMGKPM